MTQGLFSVGLCDLVITYPGHDHQVFSSGKFVVRRSVFLNDRHDPSRHRADPSPTGATGPTGPSRHHALEGVGDGRYTLTTTDTNLTTIATITIADGPSSRSRRTARLSSRARVPARSSRSAMFINERRRAHLASRSGRKSLIKRLVRRRTTSSFSVSGNTVLVQVTGAANEMDRRSEGAGSSATAEAGSPCI